MRLTKMAAEFDSRGVGARAIGDEAQAALYFSLARVHRLFMYNNFMNGAEFAPTYDPTLELEGASDELFTTLADWAHNAPEAWQRASYALALFRTEKLWQPRQLSIPRRHELARKIVESELRAAADALAIDSSPKARGTEFTTAWRRAASFARVFGLWDLITQERSSLLPAATSLLADACWWSVGVLKVFVDISSDKSTPGPEELERASAILTEAEERVVATKSFQCLDDLVAIRSRLRTLAGAPPDQQGEARHRAELLLRQIEAQETHWLRAAWFNDVARLLEQAGDRSRADEMKRQSVAEMRRSEGLSEMKTLSTSVALSDDDIKAHLARVLGTGSLPERMTAMAAHFFVAPLDRPDSSAPSDVGIAAQLSTTVTFVDDRVKMTVGPDDEAKEDREAQKRTMIAVGVGNVFIAHAWQDMLAPLMSEPDDLVQFIMPDFEEENRGLWARLARAVCDNDWAVVVHLAAPRAERVIRETLQQAGESTTARDRFGGGLLEKSFGDLVRDAEKSGRLSSSLATFLRSILTEEWGLNLRNRVAHGLVREDECTELAALRLIHVLIVLRSWSDQLRTDVRAGTSKA